MLGPCHQFIILISDEWNSKCVQILPDDCQIIGCSTWMITAVHIHVWLFCHSLVIGTVGNTNSNIYWCWEQWEQCSRCMHQLDQIHRADVLDCVPRWWQMWSMEQMASLQMSDTSSSCFCSLPCSRCWPQQAVYRCSVRWLLNITPGQQWSSSVSVLLVCSSRYDQFRT